MKQHLAQIPVRAFLLFALACGAVAGAHAQPSGPSLVHNSDRRASELERETTKKRDPKGVLAEVNQDLARLKELSEGISAYTTTPSNAPNYKYISESVAEIKKRSSRLRTSLALPKNEDDTKDAAYKDAEKAELEPTLATLNKLLNGFLYNPIFSDAGAIDMQLAAKAGRDLDEIIVLSNKLRKNAEKRSKLASKAP